MSKEDSVRDGSRFGFLQEVFAQRDQLMAVVSMMAGGWR